VEQSLEVEGAFQERGQRGKGSRFGGGESKEVTKEEAFKRQEGNDAGDSERLHGRRKALEGLNPMSGFGMK
jgi:hypothetical protein